MHTETYQTLLDAALTTLRQTRQLLLKEIANYPLPIAGCDAQYAQLVSDRDHIAGAIKSLEASPSVDSACLPQDGTILETW